VITLTCIAAASIGRMTYTSMCRVLSSQYILVGHADGIAPHRLIYKYALKNPLMPVITFVGLQIGFLAPVQWFVMVVMVVYLCVNLLADLLVDVRFPRCGTGPDDSRFYPDRRRH
jgi:ABC-type dipeptide/oligopeptide/nickel transport system permease component